LTRALFKTADPRWICLGLLIPDLPWILQRVLLSIPIDIPPYAIRAYVVGMSAPLMCSILSAAIASLFKKWREVFSILLFGSMVHLLLDAVQEKGGLGIPLAYPFYFETFSYPLFSMNGWISVSITFIGLLTTLYILLKPRNYFPFPKWTHEKHRLILCGILVWGYLTIPAMFLEATIRSNVHDTGVISGLLNRTGASVHFDRAHFTPGVVSSIKNSTMPSAVEVVGIDLNAPALVSGKAIFVSENTLEMQSYEAHPRYARFSYTMVGLLAIIAIWIRPILSYGMIHQGPKVTR
jgi:hypothetical protein